MARNAARWLLVLFATLTTTDQPIRAMQMAAAAPPLCEIQIQPNEPAVSGLCGPVFGNKEATTLTGRVVSSFPGGVGRGDATPTLMLVGELPTQWGNWNLELEFYGNDGVIRTPGGWRPAIRVSESNDAKLRFRIAEDAAVEPTDIDRRIVERAAELLTSEAVWDRADDRTCTPDDRTWSLYCALHRATVEISGGFHHRRPCLQIVRAILYERVAEERKKGRKYPHVMADYNNDPTTRLVDVQSVFAEAAARMKR